MGGRGVDAEEGGDIRVRKLSRWPDLLGKHLRVYIVGVILTAKGLALLCATGVMARTTSVSSNLAPID